MPGHEQQGGTQVAGLTMYRDQLMGAVKHVEALDDAFGKGYFDSDMARAAIGVVTTPGLVDRVLDATDPTPGATDRETVFGAADDLTAAVHSYGSWALHKSADRMSLVATTGDARDAANAAQSKAKLFDRWTDPERTGNASGMAIIGALTGLRMWSEAKDSPGKVSAYLEAMGTREELETDMQALLGGIKQRANFYAQQEGESVNQEHVAAGFRDVASALLLSDPAARQHLPFLSRLVAARGITPEAAEAIIAKLPNPKLMKFGIHPVIRALNSVLPEDRQDHELEQLAHVNIMVRAGVRVAGVLAVGKHVNRKLSALPSVGPVLQALHSHLPKDREQLHQFYDKIGLARTGLAAGRTAVGAA